jgi:hypothetical protein
VVPLRAQQARPVSAEKLYRRAMRTVLRKVTDSAYVDTVPSW